MLCLETIADRLSHYHRLFSLAQDIAQLPEDCLEITVDFSYCEFLGHFGVAFLGGLVHLIQARGGCVHFDWKGLLPKIRTNLAQNGFFHHFGGGAEPWDGNSIPYRRDLQYDTTDIGDYLRYKWLGKGWVNISPGLQAAIAGQVSEIYLNAFEHSQSSIGVFSCGQHYPNQGMLHLTVIDFGIGIPANVRSLSQNVSLTPSDAFAWAFQAGTTTKINGISRGLGLNLLQAFVIQNHGSLMIFSNDGYVVIDGNGTQYRNSQASFAGTLVNIAFQCDEQYYCLASEVPQRNKPLF